jgi:hypothetical protein
MNANIVITTFTKENILVAPLNVYQERQTVSSTVGLITNDKRKLYKDVPVTVIGASRRW